MQKVKSKRKETMIQWLQTFRYTLSQCSEEIDKISNIVLGYVIALTSLIAFSDVFGDGAITSHAPLLIWLWVVAQGFTVELQLFLIVNRLFSYWKNRMFAMFWLNVFFVLLLLSMSVMVASTFTELNLQSATLDNALSHLGIPMIPFIYSRAIVSGLLLLLIGLERALDKEDETRKQETRNNVSMKQHAETMETIVSKLETFVNRVNVIETSLHRIVSKQDEIGNILQETTLRESLHARRQDALEHSLQETQGNIKSLQEETLETIVSQLDGLVNIVGNLQETHETTMKQSGKLHLVGGKTTNKQLVLDYIRDNPQATVTDIERDCKVSKGYASRIRNSKSA